MGTLTKRKIIALFLSLILFLTALPIGGVGADATEKAAQPTLSENELKSCTVVVNYRYEDNTPAFEPFVATIEYGGAFDYTAVSPEIVGYAPYIIRGESYVDAKNVKLQYDNLTEDKVIDVVYRPILVDYTVRHYIQNINDDDYEFYTETRGQQYTGSPVGKCEIDIDGFSALYYEYLTTAADGSTVIEVYYDRNYYLIDFDLHGGYGAEPVYARFGSVIDVKTPSRSGYSFSGYELTAVNNTDATEAQKQQYALNGSNQITVPDANLSYSAVWNAEKASYTVVYWKENADDDGYCFWGSQIVGVNNTGELDGTVKSGDIVSGSDDIPSSISTSIVDGSELNERKYFTYNAEKTDKDVVVRGDGSTVVNVYYTRNEYNIYFRGISGSCAIEEHEHDENCSSTLCTKPEHIHNDFCYENSSRNVIYVVTAKYQQTIGDVWPTAANFPNINLSGWTIDGVNYTSVSKRINMTADLCDTTDRLKYAKAELGGRKRYLYYMFESFDQTSGEDGNNRVLFNGVYYDKSQLYYQEVNSDGEWRQKEIVGMSPVPNGVVSSRENIFLYYKRNCYELYFQNVNTIVKTVSGIMYQYPLNKVTDSDGNYVSTFIPEYPATLEPNAYCFAGWYTTPECFDGTEYDFESGKMPNGDLTLYAKWAPVQHEVKIYLDATLKNQIGTTQIVEHNSLAAEPEEEVKNGNYSFSGWFYVDGDGKEKAFVFDGMPVNRSMNIYAKWSSKVAVKYEIYYKLQGSDTQIADPVIGSTLAGMNKTFLAKGGSELYSDYQEGYFPITNSHTVTMDVDGDNIFTFWYVEKESVPYTVRYVDKESGNELLAEKYVENNKKAVVTEVFEQISGYMPDAYQKRLVLSADNSEENVITFYYTKDAKHAYYRIVHYIQNLSGNGYTEYGSIETVGDINSAYSAEALNIPGFKFNGEKTENNSDSTKVSGATVSGTLTAKGLLIELFYDRVEVEYTVKYLEKGTDKVLADEKSGSGIYGGQISESYIDIGGYELIGTPNRTLTLSAASERNEIIFYYQEKNIKIQYVAIGGGKVSIGSENVPAVNGNANGSVPMPDEGYKFAGWYLDNECTTSVDSSWVDNDTNKLTPQKTNGLYKESTYYAEFIRAKGSLTIEKTGEYSKFESIDPNQTFLFSIEGNGIELTVSIHGNGKTKIVDLPAGEYKVTELTDWSWRYSADNCTKKITVTSGENSISFNNTRFKQYWLDGDSYKVNEFKDYER